MEGKQEAGKLARILMSIWVGFSDVVYEAERNESRRSVVKEEDMQLIKGN